jgi:hypothetical protein
MFKRKIAVIALVYALLLPGFVFGQAPTQPRQNSPQTGAAQNPNDPIVRIKDEGMNRSQVMKTISHITDVIGPRLTGSPSLRRANEWTRDKFTEWGLQNAHLDPWGPFGRGWTLQKFSAQLVEPQYMPIIAYPKAWSPGTNGPVTSNVVYIDAKDEAGLEKYKGKLKGAIVLTSAPRAVQTRFEPLASRRDDKALLALADAAPSQGGGGFRFQMTEEQRKAAQFAARKAQFYQEEGVAVLIEPSLGVDSGTVRVMGASVPQPFSENPFSGRGIRAWDPKAPNFIPQVVASAEHYNRIFRLLEQGEQLKMAVDITVQFHDKDLMQYNTVAEIPGTDLKDEVVMLGAHLDSWHAGTGATDNGAGVAVVMEAVRIIQALGLKPRRTIRVALWTGEEQGLYGSRAYVAKHIGTIGDGTPNASINAMAGGRPATITPGPEYNKVSAYYNLDNGTGKIRGVYMQGNEPLRSIFREWLQPLRELGATTLTIGNTGSTDHVSFDTVGVPGFQFIQDEIDYFTRSWHTNQDVLDRIQAEDLKQASTVMAAFIYQTAMMNEKLPRKQMAQNALFGLPMTTPYAYLGLTPVELPLYCMPPKQSFKFGS